MSDDQQIGFQGGGDDDEMPPEMKAHMLAAFAHKEGLGPHPGMYRGPARSNRADSDDPTDTDRQRAEEEPLEDRPVGEASAAKMHAAQTSGGDIGLGPSAMDTAAVKQRNASQQQTAAQGQQQAAQAQGAQAPVNAPAAPSGPAGTTQPFPAQRGPQPQPGPTAGLPGPGMGAPPPPTPGGQEEPPGT